MTKHLVEHSSAPSAECHAIISIYKSFVFFFFSLTKITLAPLDEFAFYKKFNAKPKYMSNSFVVENYE